MNRLITTSYVACLAIAIVFGGGKAYAQFTAPSDFRDEGNRYLQVDWAAFQADDSGLIRLELYYQIFNRGLEFTEADGKLTAQYELLVTIDDDADTRVETISRDRRIVLESADRAKSRYDFRTSQVNVNLPAGKYEIQCSLQDKTSGKVIRRELRPKLESLSGDSPRLSGVEFVQAFSMKQDDSAGLFDKGGAVVIPSVSRVYGGESNQRLVYYLEIYPGESKDSTNVVVETRIRQGIKGMLYRDTLHVTLSSGLSRQLREVSIDGFTPGAYEMEVYLLGRRNKKLDERREPFEILWTEEGTLKNDWETTVSQLSLIARKGELDNWKNIASYEERQRVFVQFWVDRDPTAGTPTNEAMIEFYHRIAVANHSFANVYSDGWRTDRGRIYVKYGQPDQVDDEPFSTDALPYQIWHYYTQGAYRRFLFVDEREDGDYRLQYPYDGLHQLPDF
jgi:GWxTD domain-containing protein